MKKWGLLFAAILVALGAACVTIVPDVSSGEPTPPPNRMPAAYIDVILPGTAPAGEPVTFRGHGADDGAIVAFEWRSSLDGILSATPSFTTSSLSTGTHTIYFRAMDNMNLWSAEATGTVSITAKATGPVINSFDAVPSSIMAGSPLTLSWSVTGADTVSIDNGVGLVPAVGTRIMYPRVRTMYTLTAVNSTGTTTAGVAVEVFASRSTSNPIIHYFNARHLGGTSWELQWSVSNASSIVIQPDIGQVEPTGGMFINTPVSRTYTLTATNDWGWSKYWVTINY